MKTTDIDILLRTLVIKKASDLHVQVGTPPVFRVHGELKFSDLEPLKAEDVEAYIKTLLPEELKDNPKQVKRFDLSYAVPGIARFRVNIYKQRGEMGVALRVIPFEIPSYEELGLPEVLKKLSTRPNGLILVTGPTGSGKSTTLAAIINEINQTRNAHIITIEDPIEFVHKNGTCMVNQREVGADTDSFSAALRDALREDPDVILVGELRDLETISMALTAAETGHLVFATVHTNDVAQTVHRMIDVFPPHQQDQVRTQLAVALQGVVTQTLLRKKDGEGRVGAFETMVVNAAIRNLIKEGKEHQIYNVVQTGRQEGMMLLKDSLKALIASGQITEEEALTKVADPNALKAAVAQP